MSKILHALPAVSSADFLHHVVKANDIIASMLLTALRDAFSRDETARVPPKSCRLMRGKTDRT
jgi:hypothetical protein